MISVLTIEQMRSIDEKTIGGDISIGYSYMLKAGQAVFEEAKKLVPDPAMGEIAVICGKGNNGGDGYVAARLLLENGYNVMCFGLCGASELRGEARLAFSEYTSRKGNFLLVSDAADIESVSRYSLIIDALLGTGIKGNPRGLCAAVIKAINSSGRPVLAIDTPSGLDCDTGHPGDPCIKATCTVTMGFPKLGAYLYPGKEYIGELKIKNLGYPDELLEKFQHPGIFIPTKESLKKMLPPRKPAGSKFDHGLVFMLCGSRGMSGAAALASFSALKTGCGMVHLATPLSLVPILSQKLTEVVVYGIEETEEGTPSLSALKQCLELSDRHNVLCIGSGISHSIETSRLVRELVASVKKPVLLDADGINAYKDNVEQLQRHQSQLVITPHAGEWARLFGPLPNEPLEAFEILRLTAQKYSMTILYKGNPSVVVDTKGDIFLLPFGNSALATAGSGDVLSGIISSLIAQGCKVTEAAILGTYIHQQAGNAACSVLGEYSTIASDIIAHLHVPILELQKSRKIG